MKKYNLLLEFKVCVRSDDLLYVFIGKHNCN